MSGFETRTGEVVHRVGSTLALAGGAATLGSLLIMGLQWEASQFVCITSGAEGSCGTQAIFGHLLQDEAIVAASGMAIATIGAGIKETAPRIDERRATSIKVNNCVAQFTLLLQKKTEGLPEPPKDIIP